MAAHDSISTATGVLTGDGVPLKINRAFRAVPLKCHLDGAAMEEKASWMQILIN